MTPPVKEPLAGLALLVIFGFLIWNNRPIGSSGPFYPPVQYQNPNTTGHAYESRFWEDPFAFDPPDPKEEKSKGYCKKQLSKEIKAIKNPVKILAPLLKVRPDTLENGELRTRHRNAVIAGLIESGYRPLKPGYRSLEAGHRPLEPGHLHFCSSQENTSKQEYDVRWEHYSRESQDESDKGKSDIIVVWMNSEIFVDNNKFQVMSKNLLASKEIIENNFYIYDLNNILDKNRSAKITKEIKDINKNNQNQNIKLVKPAGSDKALTDELAQELRRRNIKEPSEEVMIITEYDSENIRSLASSFQKSLCEFFGADNPVTESSTCKTRNVFYLKGLDANQQRSHKQDKSENQAADKQADHRPLIDLRNSPPPPIGSRQLDYFHRLAGQIKGPHDDIDLKKRDSGIKAVGIFGGDFHDKLIILEALRTQMPHILVFTTDLDAQMLYYPKHWRSTRNLVVASHFDLLFRKKTKDGKNRDDKNEDEKTSFWQRSYQDQFPPFRDSQQINIFYRTLSIAAGDASGIEESKKTFPRIFEVGRNGFVRLAQENSENLNHKPADTAQDKAILPLMSLDQTISLLWSLAQAQLLLLFQDQTKLRLLLLAGIVVSLICFHSAIRPWSRPLSICLSISAVAIFAIAFVLGVDVFGTNESKEPFSFTDGVSLWPTLFIQIIASFLAIWFFVQAMFELDMNSCRLGIRYFSIQLPPFSVCPSELELWVWARTRRRFLRLWLRVRGLSAEGWIPFVVLIVTIIVYAWNDVDPSEFPFWWCFPILAVVATIYLIKIGSRDHISIKHWMETENWGHLPQVNHERHLWRQYRRYGRFGLRIARVVWIWLIFAIIETLLVYLLPPWPLPWRGATDPACWIIAHWAPGIGVLSFTVTMLLLFFILDAVRLNFYWIKKLRTQHPLLTGHVPGGLSYTAVPVQLARLEDIVSLVAERTRAVDKLIYYPMLCIMLMLFAKITYFDNQDFPLSKGITFGAAISFLFLSGFVLRREANELRLCIKKSVWALRVNNANAVQGIDETVRRIDAIDEGAFQSMLEQPVMQALLMILASIGLFAGEYLKLLG